jgi:maleylpyruvate isomerase
VIALDLAIDLVGAHGAQQVLGRALPSLTDAQARADSLLPGWTVGHVLTHVARNADSHVRMFEGALRGEVADQYPGGFDQRTADIEAGADRCAGELVADVLASSARLRDAWFAMDDAAWRGEGRVVEGVWPVTDLPFRRWREVEVHHADLGLRFTWRDWSRLYTERELARCVAASAGRTSDGREVEIPPGADERSALAWLLGRADSPAGAPELAPWQATMRTKTR